MLEDWILEIRQDVVEYQSNTWKYHISGNALELSVLRPFVNDKETYRCAIIAIGRVLKKLSCKIEECSSHFLIQSFPTLENPEIIASIRMDKNDYQRNIQILPVQDFKNQSSFNNELQALSKFYQMYVEQINPSILEDLIQEIDLNENCHLYILYSKFDNPFTWLNVGYWKETLVQNLKDEYSNSPHILTDFCNLNLNNREEINNSNLKELNPQALLALEL